MYLFLAVLGLHCFAQAFSSRFRWGTSFVAVLGFLLLSGDQTPRAVAPVVVARGLGGCGSRALDTGSVVVMPGLSCSTACEIFPEQG